MNITSKEVWITWMDAEGNKLFDTVELEQHACINHLRKAFVKQRQGHSIDHAYVEVREAGGSEKLLEDVSLKDYFVDKQDDTNNHLPGRSRDTALVLTLPFSWRINETLGAAAEETNTGDSGLYYIRESHTILTKEGDESSNISPIRRNESNVGIEFEFEFACSEYSNIRIVKALQHVEASGEIHTRNLMDLLPSLNQKNLKSAISLVNHCGIEMEGEVTEMPLQQFTYSPLSALFLATAGGESSPKRNYRADSNVESHVWVYMKDDANNPGDEYQRASLTMQPDAAVTLIETFDSIGMMEIKPPNKNWLNRGHLFACDKCTLATAGTAIILSKCLDRKRVDIGDLALPFVLANGNLCSLFVTRLDVDGQPYVSRVVDKTNGNSFRHVNFIFPVSERKSQLFVALAVLLNNVLELLAQDEGWKNRLDKLFKPAPRNLIRAISSRSNKRKTKSETEDSESNSKTSKKSNTMGSAKNMESMAMEAATCDGRFHQIKYPFLRNLVFTSSDCHIDSQTESPFYFRGLDRNDEGQAVFIKVWSVADVSETHVARECTHLWAAHTAGVPVARPIFERIVKSRCSKGDIEFFVLATELIEEKRITSPSEMLRFAIALITAVNTLHDKAGILHCDLKPDNICWNGNDALLIDFGHGQPVADAKWSPGTEGFEAPEILRKERPSVMSDAFAVGRVIQCVLERDISVAEQSSGISLLTDLRVVAHHLCEELPVLRWSLDKALGVLSDKSISKRKDRPGHHTKGGPFPSEKMARNCVPSF